MDESDGNCSVAFDECLIGNERVLQNKSLQESNLRCTCSCLKQDRIFVVSGKTVGTLSSAYTFLVQWQSVSDVVTEGYKYVWKP